MNNELNKGTYVLAISGGVDSMVLLDMLANRQGSSKFVVAHFDHGIRSDSRVDADLVKRTAAQYGIPFVVEHAQLGADTSEALARASRYAFLRRVAAQYKADAIVTAHHQDDLLETICLHLQRGTGRWGLSPMVRTKDIIRPLLDMTKKDILDYAQQNNIIWREDSTNSDTKYARNKLRTRLAKASENNKKALLDIYKKMSELNPQIDKLVDDILVELLHKDTLDRKLFSQLPVTIAYEVMIAWLKKQGITSYDRATIGRLVEQATLLTTGKRVDVGGAHWLTIEKSSLRIMQK